MIIGKDRWRAAMALCFLSLVSAALLFGSGRLVRLLRAWPVRSLYPKGDPAAAAQEATLAVSRACRYYPFKAECLHRAAASVCYLRWRGHAANLVIGVKTIPFAAHAWVELDGVVVNDRPSVRDDFTVIDVATSPGRN
jgi:hypothetical protein